MRKDGVLKIAGPAQTRINLEKAVVHESHEKHEQIQRA